MSRSNALSFIQLKIALKAKGQGRPLLFDTLKRVRYITMRNCIIISISSFQVMGNFLWRSKVKVKCHWGRIACMEHCNAVVTYEI